MNTSVKPGLSPASGRPRLARSSAALLSLVLLVAYAGPAAVPRFNTPEDDPRPALAPVDWGPGPGLPRQRAMAALGTTGAQTAATTSTTTSAVPVGPADAHLMGLFGPAFAWPLIPIHSVLLPDGRVLGYGSKPDGLQSGLLHYSLWDPALGTGDAAMQLLPNQTGTDIFCAGQALLPGAGEVLLVGGDRLVGGVRNFANNDVNLFNPADNSLTRQTQSMAYQRWYATLVTNAQGEQVTMGGRIDRAYTFDDGTPATVDTYASTPEVYRSDLGWRTLSTANSDRAYGADQQSWNYPRAWLAPDGRVVVFNLRGELHALDSTGTGSLVKLPGLMPRGRAILPGAMFEPGRILSLRLGGLASVVDLNGATPVISATGNLSLDRQYGNATLLADGQVFVNGGSSTGNDLVGAAYHSETWNPATGAWTTTASAAKPRLYHSTSLLLPDATVLTNGGGAPGPVVNLNAEIYYPPYLYRPDGSGRPAVRPVIASTPQAATWDAVLRVVMSNNKPVSRLTLVRFGAVTHAFNNDQRFQNLAFTQKGKVLQARLPASATLAPPGFYMVFAFNSAGVPSVAKLLRLD